MSIKKDSISAITDHAHSLAAEQINLNLMARGLPWPVGRGFPRKENARDFNEFNGRTFAVSGWCDLSQCFSLHCVVVSLRASTGKKQNKALRNVCVFTSLAHSRFEIGCCYNELERIVILIKTETVC